MNPLRIRIFDGPFAVCRLAPGEAIPEWARGQIVSITRTPDELSIVCEENHVPEDVRSERGWRAFRVEGPIPFETTGVAAALTAPLAAAGISLLLVATFDTDILFVRSDSFQRAAAALRQSGFQLV